MDAKNDEINGDNDRFISVHDGPRHRVVVVEQVSQQSLLVGRVTERVGRCSQQIGNYTKCLFCSFVRVCVCVRVCVFAVPVVVAAVRRVSVETKWYVLINRDSVGSKW